MTKASHILVGLGLMLAASQVFGQNFTVLHNFTNSPDGRHPEAGLFLSGNMLYGTTYDGGLFGNGTIFKINTDGSDYTVLYNFSAFGLFSTNGDGANPLGTLVLGGDTLYGTTAQGGYGTRVDEGGPCGTVFSITTNGTGFTILKFISGSQPYPHAGLVLSSNTLYGTTYGAGNSFGTAFAINTNGTGFTNLNSFGGKRPQASLILGSNTLYGTAWGSGSYDYGSVFAINTDGMGFTNLIQFRGPFATNGGQAAADLVLKGNTLYGTCASFGGPGGLGGGTVFKINTDGAGFTILKTFVNSGNAPDGSAPVAGLVLSGSTLYGTTKWGGSGGKGTVFRVDTDGTGYSVLKNFTSNDGANPLADLVLDGNKLYGTTQLGGNSGFGVVFSLTLPPPSLQITNAGNLPIIFWVDDAQNHILQITTDLTAGSWSSISELNWTNNSNGTLQIGYQIVNPIVSPAAFFRLQ